MRLWSRRHAMQAAGTVGIGLLAGCGRLPFQAQQPAKVPRIGYLAVFPDAPESSAARFLQGLRDLGYVEGQNFLVEWRRAEPDSERLPDLAAELVRLPVDVIVAEGIAIAAARNATSEIPIVMVGANDPVASGLVASLSRPGGNVTGMSGMAVQLSAKRLQLLKEAMPASQRVAVLWHRMSATIGPWEELQTAAAVLGLQLVSLEVTDASEFESAFDLAAREGAEAVYLVPDAFMSSQVPRTVALLTESRLPAMYPRRAYAAAGGLMSYGPVTGENPRRAATYVDRILKGTKPADLPVEQPRDFEFVINLKTAQALGLAIPPHVLLQATEVIQ
jgi:putative tryptophan/tyrosine transport system substrate-binding protein